MLKDSVNTTRQLNAARVKFVGKDKLSLFVGDMTIYLENSKETTGKRFKQERCKIINSKQESVPFLYESNNPQRRVRNFQGEIINHYVIT